MGHWKLFLENDTRQGHRDQRDKLVLVTAAQDAEGMRLKKEHEGAEVAGGILLNKIYFS